MFFHNNRPINQTVQILYFSENKKFSPLRSTPPKKIKKRLGDLKCMLYRPYRKSAAKVIIL